jgi:RNA polymerase sigma-70 factor (ECF subfamily)
LTQREIARQLGCSATLVNFMLRDATQAVASCRDLLDDA